MLSCLEEEVACVQWVRQFLCGELILAAVAAAWKFLRAPPPKADNAIPFSPFTVQH